MKATTQRTIRRLHLYLGMFFAPAILFFAVSGGIQTFRLTERPGAPAWTQWIASLHKDQAPPRPRPARPAADRHADDHDDHGGDHDRPAAGPARHDPFALKVFVGLMSIGLTLSTLLGIAVALTLPAARRVSIVALIAGAVLPLALLL